MSQVKYLGSDDIFAAWSAGLKLADRPLVRALVSAEIRELVDRYPLPAGVEDLELNKEEIAAALGTTLPTLSRWMQRPGFPILQHGGQGKSYAFQLSHVFAWHRHYEAQELERSAKARAVVGAMQASFLARDDDDPIATMSLSEQRDLIRLDFERVRAERERRQLCRLDDVTALLSELMITYRESLETLADRLERELSLSTEQIALVQRAARDTLEAIEARIRQEQIEVPDVAYVPLEPQLEI